LTNVSAAAQGTRNKGQERAEKKTRPQQQQLASSLPSFKPVSLLCSIDQPAKEFSSLQRKLVFLLEKEEETLMLFFSSLSDCRVYFRLQGAEER
jgi:hypothetical protein